MLIQLKKHKHIYIKERRERKKKKEQALIHFQVEKYACTI